MSTQAYKCPICGDVIYTSHCHGPPCDECGCGTKPLPELSRGEAFRVLLGSRIYLSTSKHPDREWADRYDAALAALAAAPAPAVAGGDAVTFDESAIRSAVEPEKLLSWALCMMRERDEWRRIAYEARNAAPVPAVERSIRVTMSAETAARLTPPTEARDACPCKLATCVEPWEPGCGLGTSEAHAVAARDPAMQAVEDGKDAARYRWLRDRTRANDATPRRPQSFLLPHVEPVSDLMRGSVAQHLDAAIDAAMQATGAESKEVSGG